MITANLESTKTLFLKESVYSMIPPSVVVFAMLQGFPAAGLRSSMSGLVDRDEQGRLFAIVVASESSVTLAAIFIFNGWYSSTLDTFDGTCFEFAAGLCVLALLITVYVHMKLRSAKWKEQSMEIL